jgi:glycerol-3-phosphate O-acyltransferase
VPVGINYDRTLEDRSLVRRLDPNAPRRSGLFVVRTTLGFIARNLWLMLRSRWHRFGYASVSFGTPVSAREWCREEGVNPATLSQDERFRQVEKLAGALMQRVARMVPVLPIPLVAEALLAAPEGVTDFDLKARIYRRIEALQARGAVIMVPSHTRTYTVDTALDMLRRRHLVIEQDGQFRAAPEGHDVLAYYANSLCVWPGGTGSVEIPAPRG